MADYIVNFKANGGEQVNQQINNILKGTTATSNQIVALSKVLNTSAKSAAAFAANIGLGVPQTTQLVSRLKQLQQSGLSSVEAFRLLHKETGVTMSQFRTLNNQLKSADQQLKDYAKASQDAADAQQQQADASAAQILALQQVNQAASQLAGALQQFTQQATSEFIEFDDALTSISAKTGIAKEDLGGLKDAIFETALVTSQSPTAAAQAADALIALGATADQAGAKVKTVAQLADALRTVGATAELSAKTLQLGSSIFGQFGETAETVGDKIAYISDTSAAASNTGLSEFIQLFSKVGGLASQLGVGLDDLLASFAIIRDSGQGPEEAATALKTVIARILSQKEALEALGVTVFNSNNQFVGLTKVFKRLNEQNVDLTTQFSLFGQEGAAAANALTQNYQKVEVAAGNLANTQGSLQAKSDAINSSIKGQAELLQGSLQTAMVDLGKSIGQFAAPSIDIMLKLVNAFIAAPQPIKDFVGISLGLATAGASVVAALTGFALALKALEAAQLGATLKTLASVPATVAQGAAATQAAIANGVLANSLRVVGVASVNAVGSLFTLVGAVLPLTAALAGVVAAGKLVAESYDASVGPANRAGDAIDNLNAEIEKYNEATGQTISQTEETKGRFEQLGDGIKEVGANMEAGLKNFDLFGLIASANEAAASGLSVKAGDLTNSLGTLNDAFLDFKSRGELGSEAAQALIPSLQAAQQAIATLQQEALGNKNVSEAQIDIWASQQRELMGLIDELNAASTANEEGADTTGQLGDAAEDAAQSFKDLQDALTLDLSGIESGIKEAQAAAYAELEGNKEALEQRLTEIESEGLEQRLARQQKFLADVKQQTFDSEEEKAKAIADAEDEIADTRLQINKEASDRLIEQAEEEAKKKEEIEKEFQAVQVELAEKAFQQKQTLLDRETRALESALDDRVAAQNAAIESIDDQSDALNQQLEVMRLIGEQNELIGENRLTAIDNEIEALRTVQDLSDGQIDNSERILELEEQRRQEVEDQLLAKQEIEDAELAFQQELKRLDLDRQVRQAEINAIEAEREVIQARQLAKSQELELSEQNRLITAAQLNGAKQSEIIQLEAQRDLVEESLRLSNEGIGLAQESAKLAAGEVDDAKRAREQYEDIAVLEKQNLEIKQEQSRESLKATQESERTASAIANASDNAEDLEANTANVKSTASGAADEFERGARAIRDAVSATETLSKLQGKTINQQREIAKGALGEGLARVSKVSAGGTTQYFVGGKEVSAEEYQAEIAAQKEIQKASGRSARSFTFTAKDAPGADASVEELKAYADAINKGLFRIGLLDIGDTFDKADKRAAEALDETNARIGKLLNEQAAQALELAAAEAEQLRQTQERLEVEQQITEEKERQSELSGGEQLVTAIPRRLGGPVAPGNLYQVNEAGMEAFRPAGSNSLIPLLQPSNSLFSPSVPGTILNASQTSGAIANAGLLAEIRGLRADLARRPVPVLNAPANFTNAPSPLATQIQWLQGTMKAMRGAI